MGLPFTTLTAEEAAAQIEHGQTVAFSGFTPAGSPKAIPSAIAARAEALHERGEPFKIGVITGASTGPSLDGALAKADAISFRTPYQSNPDLRARINAGETRFFDMHLSMLPQAVRSGSLGPIDWAVIEACDVTPGGGIVLTSAVGAAPTFGRMAKRVFIELNRRHSSALLGMHDIYEPADPPHRGEIGVFHVSDRIGSPIMLVDPSRIAGIVETDRNDETAGYDEATPATDAIGEHVADFLTAELAAQRLPYFAPIQSGVGNIGNAVMAALGNHAKLPPFEMYTEVLQDSAIDLICSGRVRFASTCGLTLSPAAMDRIYDDLGFFRSRILMRPQEISNHPEVIRRLGLVSINTALEVDLFGNVNSTHVMGRQMMNGIGGSGDFTRNASLSIFICPSMAKGGKISTVVPLVSHADHSEHSVQVIITEQGIADLRGRTPQERAELMIENCAHPEYREELRGYLQMVKGGHTPHTLRAAFAFHCQFQDTGDMHGVDWKRWGTAGLLV
jgi:propionyl-CoA:succinyl-CoA transferase